MPLIRGVKFACEPCIRGHRSSKCNHSDRVLVQVRKPGRPLSSCPHTLSSSSPGTFVHSLPAGASGGNVTGNSGETGGMSCSCDVTSVAIPKIASCACGTSKPHEPAPRPPSLSIAPSPSQSPPTNASPLTMITSPMSPISPTIISTASIINGPINKISKSQRSKKRDGPVRRGSVITGEVALELLLEQERERSESSESLKMENTGGNCGEMTGISNGNGSTNGNGNGVQRLTETFPAAIESGEGVNGFHPPQKFPHAHNRSVPLEGSKQLSVTSDGMVAKPATLVGVNDILPQDIWVPDGGSPWQLPQPAKKTGCGGCNGKSPQSPQPQLQQQYIHHTPTLPPNSKQASSCCNGPNKIAPIQQQQPIPVPHMPFSAPQFFSAPQYPPSYIPVPNFPQVPNAWMYSTINHPITHQEFAWLQQQRAAGLFGPQPIPQLPSHVPLSPQVVNNPPIVGNTLGNSWAHSCHCGPDCNCLGCATHPFNRRTVEHVREMQTFMTGENRASNSHNHSNSHTLTQQILQPHQNGFKATSISFPPAAPAAPSPKEFGGNGNSTSGPTASSSCCDNEISQEEQQVSPPPEPEDETGVGGTPGGTDTGGELSPSNFIYFDYPLGMCAQTEAGCKCGEGCTCVGCITHGGHDGVELEGCMDGDADWDAWEIEGGS